ncbi:respiratory nitrate reductase subunit gamma [Acetobacter pasteurianus]|jgi:nitrate reductase gamma subunit|uniref:nitrate reductase (quinone) n=7 Tax=Acetobacter TaxID=434 RepID=A0A149UQX5_9PROT|nr:MULTISPECIES: respiratory nitrate reductase subunit gamma [Acetobacter]RCL04759.1 respiratory nitrate reductase subunit gamma [Acetobacter pasteurianus]AOW49174.1 respiratory nitrate reductase subunit gamma [Acetobacter ascendens]KXV70390.1 nitrate reductase [Acetobacter cerevisiae]KXV77751.1 nitrate reductase [Acetobacter malorum]MBB6458517.1 nitrate reductase gamma subunit [Acetobacter lovaniensis]
MNWVEYFLFQIYPYLCLSVFVIGCWARFDRSQFSWRAESSEFLERKTLKWASNSFHVGVLGLMMGHAAGLLTPPQLTEMLGLSAHAHQLLAVGAGSVFAVFAAVGGAGLIYRRVFNKRVKATSRPTDLFILLFVYAQLWLGILGLPHSMMHSDGHTMEILGEWCRGVLTFRSGLPNLLTTIPWVYKLHLVTGMTLFLLTPFTRLVHVISAPIWYVFRPGWQIVRQNHHVANDET